MEDNKINDGDKINLLIKKWELYWNFYKLQHEAYERRRYLIWLIQSALAVAWYKLFLSCNNYLKYLALCISIFGAIFSFFWFFMCKRERESILLTDEELRNAEDQINEHRKDIHFNLFHKREEIFGPNGKRETVYKEKFDSLWKFDVKIIKNLIDRLNFSENLKTVRFTLDYFTPFSFFIAWLIILLVNVIQLGYYYIFAYIVGLILIWIYLF